MFEQLLHTWGYLAILIGTFLEGETVLIVAGALAHQGLLRLDLVMASAFVGSVVGDQVWFVLGRHYGQGWISRRPGLAARALRVTNLIARFGDGFVLAFRFIWGMRTVSPILLATSGYSWRRFIVLNALGALLWSTVVASLGWFFGVSIEKVLGRAARMEEAVVVAALLIFGVWWFLRRRAGASAAGAAAPSGPKSSAALVNGRLKADLSHDEAGQAADDQHDQAPNARRVK